MIDPLSFFGCPGCRRRCGAGTADALRFAVRGRTLQAAQLAASLAAGHLKKPATPRHR
jgi:hypothetical protein